MTTVYSTVADDGTIRMALYPMDSAPNMAWLDPKYPWSFRVAFIRPEWKYVWRCSCLGADVNSRLDSLFWSGDMIGLKGSDDEAIKWLLEGEAL